MIFLSQGVGLGSRGQGQEVASAAVADEDSGLISAALSKAKKPRRNLDLSDQLSIQEPKTVLDDDDPKDFLGSSGAEFITTFRYRQCKPKKNGLSPKYTKWTRAKS